MVILGLVLVLLAVLMGIALIMGTQSSNVAGQDVDIRFFDAITISLNPLTLVLAGMLTMLLFWLGLVTIRAALQHSARKRRERKEQEARSKEALAARDRQLEEQRLSTQAARERAAVAESEAYQTRPVEVVDTADTDTRVIGRDPQG